MLQKELEHRCQKNVKWQSNIPWHHLAASRYAIQLKWRFCLDSKKIYHAGILEYPIWKLVAFDVSQAHQITLMARKEFHHSLDQIQPLFLRLQSLNVTKQPQIQFSPSIQIFRLKFKFTIQIFIFLDLIIYWFDQEKLGSDKKKIISSLFQLSILIDMLLSIWEIQN